MKNILVIGSTGQIGSELTMKLRANYNASSVVAGYIKGAEPTGRVAKMEKGAGVEKNGFQVADRNA